MAELEAKRLTVGQQIYEAVNTDDADNMDMDTESANDGDAGDGKEDNLDDDVVDAEFSAADEK